MYSNAALLPIGVFDSGVGGLTVWRELRHQLPEESILYFADTARLPYGERSPSEIQQYVREIVDWMLQHPVKAIVMACNTSSAVALEAVQSSCPVPLSGLILPGARAAVQQGERIGVIATAATVASHAYRNAIREISAEIQCWEVACPQFVPSIESGQLSNFALRQMARGYLQPLVDCQIDTLIYGCTHYPLIDSTIRTLLPESVQIVDPARSLVTAVARELEFLGLRAHRGRPGATRFCISGNDTERFARLAANWMVSPSGVSRPPVESVHLLSRPVEMPSGET